MANKMSWILILSILDLLVSIGFQAIGYMMPVSIGSSMVELGGLLMIGALLLLMTLVFYIALWIVIAKDIAEKKISWAFMALPILLGGVGGIIYYLINKDKSKQPNAAPAQQTQSQQPQQQTQ